jgi:hypothetical protein
MAEGTVSNTKHEPVWVLVGADTANLTNLGYVNSGDVSINIGQNWVDATFHQTGAMPLEGYDNGQTCEVTVEFAEICNWDLWAEVFKMGEKQEDSGCASNIRFASHSESTSAVMAGTTATSLTQVLVLRPAALYTNATTETVRDFVIPQALCVSVDSIPFNTETPNILPVTFRAYGNTDASDGQVLWYRGLTTAPDTAWVAS